MFASAAAPDGGRHNHPHAFKKHLSTARVRMVELMQDINFGRVEGLTVSAQEPVLDPRPTVVREHKFFGENGPRQELGQGEFQLKQQVIELFALLDEIENGVIEVLEVKHGLPFRVFLREEPT